MTDRNARIDALCARLTLPFLDPFSPLPPPRRTEAFETDRGTVVLAQRRLENAGWKVLCVAPGRLRCAVHGRYLGDKL